MRRSEEISHHVEEVVRDLRQPNEEEKKGPEEEEKKRHEEQKNPRESED